MSDMSDNLKSQFNPQANHVPTVIEKEGNSMVQHNLYSRMFKDRIIMLCGQVSTEMATTVMAQMQYLDAMTADDAELADKKITLYMNSPGGSISDGLAIYDTMRTLKCPVEVIGVGMCASMGSFLLAAGTPGMRRVLPNTKVMVHQPRMQMPDKTIVTEDGAGELSRNLASTRRRMEYLYAHFMGLDWEQDKKPLKDLMKNDTYLNTVMAQKLGLIDEILEPPLADSDPAVKEEFDLIMKLNQMEIDEIGSDEDMAIVNEVIALRESRLQSKTALGAQKKSGPQSGM